MTVRMGKYNLRKNNAHKRSSDELRHKLSTDFWQCATKWHRSQPNIHTWIKTCCPWSMNHVPVFGLPKCPIQVEQRESLAVACWHPVVMPVEKWHSPDICTCRTLHTSSTYTDNSDFIYVYISCYYWYIFWCCSGIVFVCASQSRFRNPESILIDPKFSYVKKGSSNFQKRRTRAKNTTRQSAKWPSREILISFQMVPYMLEMALNLSPKVAQLVDDISRTRRNSQFSINDN